MLPSDLPVSLSPHDIAILREVFDRQKPHGLWCGFTLIGEQRDAETGEPLRASRIVLFTFGTRQPYFNLLRWLDGSYVLTDRAGNILRQTQDIRQLLSIFELNLPTLH
nr:D528 [uncultured bacterium]